MFIIGRELFKRDRISKNRQREMVPAYAKGGSKEKQQKKTRGEKNGSIPKGFRGLMETSKVGGNKKMGAGPKDVVHRGF